MPARQETGGPQRNRVVGIAARMASSLPSKTECRAKPGEFVPVIDRAKCEGKSDCVDVCPYDVFEVRRMDDADFARLHFLAKLKSMTHGRRTAYTPRADACQACGKCVAECPEEAIKLARA
jgi:NAD-dependent dihydropyrimidine dehydrogenase PreA subunit